MTRERPYRSALSSNGWMILSSRSTSTATGTALTGSDSSSSTPRARASSRDAVHRELHSLTGIGRAAAQPRFLPRGGDERLDGARHLLRIARDGCEAFPIGIARPRPSERELRFRGDLGKRRAKLVRELRREALLVPQAGGEALEERIERRGELRQLVVRLTLVEALVEVVVAPGRGVVGHAGDRQQCLAEDPVREHGDRREQRDREDDRADERYRRGLVVGVERDTGDDGADAIATVDDRNGVQTNRLVHPDRALGASCELGRSRGPGGRNARLLEARLALEHPGRAPDRSSLVEARRDDELPTDDLE